MQKKTLDQKAKDDVKVLIEEAKIRNNFKDDLLAQYMGISTHMLRDRRADPGSITLDKLLILLELTGKEIEYVERR